MQTCSLQIGRCIILTVLLSILFMVNSCTFVYSQSPKISSLKADTLYVYPMGNAELQCIASAPQGDTLTFKWSATDGTFSGSGPIVTWKAPNNYGKFHIMVIVEDGTGKNSQETLTIEVVADENQQQGCSTCNRR
jgi:hypothetical protein